MEALDKLGADTQLLDGVDDVDAGGEEGEGFGGEVTGGGSGFEVGAARDDDGANLFFLEEVDVAGADVFTAVLHRYPLNQIVRAWNGRAQDRDVPLRRAIYIDIDPVRPSGISATDAEKHAAMDTRERVEEFLVRELGDPAALGRGDSGNGSFILIAIQQPCLTLLNQTSHVQRFLNLLAREFDSKHVKIDTSVGNTARLMPCPGTWKRKGENTRERPHRRVYFSCHPTVRPVPFEAIVG